MPGAPPPAPAAPPGAPPAAPAASYFAGLREEHRAHLARALAVPSEDLWLPCAPPLLRRLHRALVASGALPCATAAATLGYGLLLGLSTSDPPAGGSAAVYSALELPFAVFYTLELALRVLLLAFQRGSHRAGAWAPLAAQLLPHLCIVAVGWLEVTPGLQESYASRLTALRLARLLGPLGAIDALALRPLYRTLAICAADLASISGLYALAVLLFASVALQLFRGLLQGACTYSDGGASGLVSRWSLVPQPCALTCPDSMSCSVPVGTACASPVMVPLASGPALVAPVCTPGSSPDWGFTNFDNIGAAALTAFVLPTFEGWSSVMYSTWHAKGYKAGVFGFFVAHLALCGWLLLPITMSVLTAHAKEAQQWEGAQLEELVNGAHARWVEGGGGSSGGSARGPGAQDDEALPPPHFDSAGVLRRRRRLGSLASLPTVFAALGAVEAERQGGGGQGRAARRGAAQQRRRALPGACTAGRRPPSFWSPCTVQPSTAPIGRWPASPGCAACAPTRLARQSSSSLAARGQGPPPPCASAWLRTWGTPAGTLA